MTPPLSPPPLTPEIVATNADDLVAAAKTAAFYFPSVRVVAAALVIPHLYVGPAPAGGFRSAVHSEGPAAMDRVKRELAPLIDEGVVLIPSAPAKNELGEWLDYWLNGLDDVETVLIDELRRDGASPEDETRIHLLTRQWGVHFALMSVAEGVPTTTDWRMHHVFRTGLLQAIRRSRTPDPRTSRDLAAYQILRETLPALGGTPAEEILALRRKHRDNLIAFRSYVTETVRAANIEFESPRFSEQVKRTVEEAVSPEIVALRRHLADARRESVQHAITGKGALAAAGSFALSVHQGSPTTAAIAASALGASLLTAFWRHRRKRAALLNSSPLAFCMEFSKSAP